MTDEELTIVVLFANFASGLWSYFCIVSSIDRTSRSYDFMHQETHWYALWYACQTFALLVSFTNVTLVLYIIYRIKDSFVETVKTTPNRTQRALIGLLGVAAALLLFPASFAPYKMTLIQTDLSDENVFIKWDV